MNILIHVSMCVCVNLDLGSVSVGGIAKSQGMHAHFAFCLSRNCKWSFPGL